MGMRTFVATLGPGLVVFVLPTIGLIARNGEFFQGDFSAGRDLYLLSLLAVTFGFSLWGLSKWLVGRYLWTCYLLVTPGWFAYTIAGNWNRLLAASAIALSILTIAYLAQRPGSGFIRSIELVGVLLLLTMVATTFIEARSTTADGVGSPDGPKTAGASVYDPAPEVDPSMVTSGDKPNIYHIVMDEYQTEMFEATLNVDLEHALSGFIYYPETRTSYGRTEMSMASILGARDYDYLSAPQDFVQESLRGPSSSLVELRRAGYRTVGLSHLPSLYGSPSPFDESVILKDFVEVAPESESRALLNSLWVYANTPTGVAERVLPENDYSALAADNLLPDDAPPVSAWALQEFVTKESTMGTSGRYTLIHLILPHFPYVLSAECDYTTGRETSPREQASCANNLMVALIKELKELGRFDDSVIVIQGDHGARFELEGDNLRQLRQDFTSEAWNNARSKPLLLIKPAGNKASDRFLVSEYPAMLTDVMPTVLQSAGIQYTPRDGRTSLLRSSLPDRQTRYYHFYEKGDDGLPDGEVTRFVVESDGLRFDATITLPSA